jgi:hypothetical protein
MHGVPIAERFRRVISLHVAKNTLHVSGLGPALILGIHGPSGEGKTFQTDAILSSLGVSVFSLSGGQFESGIAGEPSKILAHTYSRAHDCVLSGNAIAAAIVIHDFDTALGDWGPLVQATTNRQQLYGDLMNLADASLGVGDRVTRIPIIITGNNFQRVYQPLARAGRMWLFEWKPTAEEKADVVQYIFPHLSRADVVSLTQRYPYQNLAFFSFLKSSIVDDQLWTAIKNLDAGHMIGQLRTDGVRGLRLDADLETLVLLADMIIREGTLADHLAPTGQVM